MAYLRYTRANVSRLRLRACLRRFTIEFSLGFVPERLSLAQQARLSDPEWDPFFQPKTLYARFRIRARSGPLGSKQPAMASAFKNGAAV